MSPRKLFIGASGPIGYDYRWRRGTQAAAEPFAVLEDLNGLLLCYDELWFLAREFCPRDMWDLPYVKFVSEDPRRQPLIATAALQAKQLQTDYVPYEGPSLADVIAVITQGEPNGVDNHSRDAKISSELTIMGNAGDIDLVLMDMLIGAALDEPGLDILTNSVGTSRLQSSMDLLERQDRVPWRAAVAANVATLRIPNGYKPGSIYVEDIEDLRAHPNIRSFRSLLSSETLSGKEATDAAEEITDMAERFARKHMSKTFRRKPLYRSAGRILVSPAGNSIHPGLGTLINGGIAMAQYFTGREDRKTGAWAAFVTDLNPSN